MKMLMQALFQTPTFLKITPKHHQKKKKVMLLKVP